MLTQRSLLEHPAGDIAASTFDPSGEEIVQRTSEMFGDFVAYREDQSRRDLPEKILALKSQSDRTVTARARRPQPQLAET